MKMIHSKSFFTFLLLLILLSVAGFSGCIGGSDTSGNNTANSSGSGFGSESVTVWSSSDYEGFTDQTVLAKGRQFVNSSVTIQTGETVRIWNREDQAHYDHLYHSEDGAFKDIRVNALDSTYLVFNKPGTYKIDLYNPDTNSFYGTTGNTVLTVTVTKP
ncbi:hypothetical protein MsAg5_14340 [Methanosarcinaceae archaeon Ag5]|uniref:EfeO-type cupredoxin-like domain-containing protein n=1 Tax=Methanolapillus africanus TaxID=3028297 RepID=A0AAE4SE89_9EURY|nr:hypothetical protein [Methanosarcinaceae archaeon Ag5]